MDFFSLLTLAGGIALFLFGMNYMGDSLKKLSGSSLESILQKLTSNRFKGFFLGLFVTAVIQSSSAVMVMLVGFVNSGIMKLAQTTSILLGANIGTTMTAWLLSTSGISGESFIFRLMKPSSFTPVLAVVGILLTMISKSEKKKDVGSILLGFAILMFGMESMSGATSGLRDSESFMKILVMFSHPIMGILIGTLFTAIIQSSSASVGILQALSLTGSIPMSTALPIILGMNIGAVVPPVLSSLSGNANAKRVAASAVSIKIIGVVIVATIFYILNGIIGFEFMDGNASVFTIALVHTVFNVISSLILMPCCGGIEKLSVLLIKEKQTEEENIFASLDDRFLAFPQFALEKSRELIGQMAGLSKQTFNGAICISYGFDNDVAEKIRKQEKLVDKYEDKLTAYLVKLASLKNTVRESNEVSTLIHVIGDIERISDYAYSIVKTARDISESGIKFSKIAENEIDLLSKAIDDILTQVVKAIRTMETEQAAGIIPLKREADRMISEIRTRHIERFMNKECSADSGFVFLDLITAMGHISSHCSNIAVYLLQKDDEATRLHGKRVNKLKNM